MTTNLRLSTAEAIVDGALEKAGELGCAPLAVAVLDAGGHPVVLKRQDDAEFLRIPIAVGKAYGSLGMGHPGRVLGERAAHAPAFFGALSDMTGGRVVPGMGGVLIRTHEGALVGAVGISGDSGERDEACAIGGIERAQMAPDYGQVEEWRRP